MTTSLIETLRPEASGAPASGIGELANMRAAPAT
jgi:hypothetical protein